MRLMAISPGRSAFDALGIGIDGSLTGTADGAIAGTGSIGFVATGPTGGGSGVMTPPQKNLVLAWICDHHPVEK